MSDDGRVAVVAALLKRQRSFDADYIAALIVKVLDQRALITKWEGERQTLLPAAEQCWIPHDDLLQALNALPGATLTAADLKAKMANMSPQSGYVRVFNEGDPDLQAACLQVYRREKRAGTEIGAIITA